MQTHATDLPIPTTSADLFLSYWGLHCFEDPGAAGFLARYREETVFLSPPQPVQRLLIALLARGER